MQTHQEIWNCDAERAQLWTEDPQRAAMLAYLEVLSLWHEQVECGVYLGIPAMHRLPDDATRELRQESQTTPSGVVNPMAKTPAMGHVVPLAVHRVWLAAA